MKQITFITVEELKEGSIIQANVDEKILAQSILEFQEIGLEPVLGKKLYRRLNNVLVSGATDSSYQIEDHDKELLTYIKPFMVFGSLLNALNALHYKITPKGVQILTDANSQTGQKLDLDSLRNTYAPKLDAYKLRLIEHLQHEKESESEDLALTTPCCSNSGADTTFGFTGIFIADNSYDYEADYKNSAYKTGYYRRIIY